MDLQLNINLDMELKPVKYLRKQIKQFHQQQYDDLYNLVNANQKDKDDKSKDSQATAITATEVQPNTT